ncbi:hypothetical protein [Enterovibrio norvegicus]|uniref:Uncharacterized protein n=1 Tax=Enterovibrio norvegicus TaxID=188144 RepID=A0A2N7L8B8_9GAMM|nr:hypothetical protein [Enterovibrio norvegicus]PMN90426.1 hypothetical protein BCT23_19930 [Enterovibrio norvegicus]
MFEGFTVPLPVVAFALAVAGWIYKIYIFKVTIRDINKIKRNSIRLAYENYLFCEANNYMPKYSVLDPEKEMEKLCKHWVIRLYTLKNASLIYSRIEDCIEKRDFLLNHSLLDKELTGSKYFNLNYYNNLILYFFLIDLLQMSYKDRIIEFTKFDNDNSYLYCRENGYFKDYLSLNNKS